jgi:antitoxin component YwqK of YwqJK toxin-antitoxin module
MKHKILTIAALLAISFSAVCQTSGDLNRTDQNGRKQGRWVKKYPNNSILYEGVFKDDHPVGEFKRYFEDNILKSVMVFSADGKTSDAILYHPNGFIASRGRFISQLKEGKWQFFSYTDSGYMFSEETYTANLKNGPSVKYYRNGKVAEKLNFIKDKQQGEWCQYYTDGTPCLKTFYKDGKLDGKYEVWTEKGKLEFSGQYKNDARDGLWQIYNPDGTVRYKMVYKDGITNDKQADIDMSDYMDLLEKNKGKISDPEKTGVIKQ